MHNELLQEEIDKELNKQVGHFIGQYEGILPCADCDGIVIQLELFQHIHRRKFAPISHFPIGGGKSAQ